MKIDARFFPFMAGKPRQAQNTYKNALPFRTAAWNIRAHAGKIRKARLIFMDEAQVRKQAEALVAQMTVEEAASQLKYDAPAIERLGIPAYNWWNEALHGVARAGTATVFPQAVSMAAMFDEEGIERVAQVISTEVRAKYNAVSKRGDRDIYKGLTCWSPNVNIFRDPRWGRGHETYGEDPQLTSRLGAGFVRGLQGKGKYLKAAACAKHFAVHSGPENLRHEFDARPTEKDLWETYLPAFETLVEESHVESVMGAYNRVNGDPACGSKRLLTDILREQWHFQGHVVSDCWAIADFHMYHHVTSTAPESAAMALKAGCDLNCGVTYLHLLAALQEGRVTEEEIRQAAVRVMATRIRLGLFASDCEYDSISPLEVDTDEHAALALEVARRSMVLLRNDGLLPLDITKLKTVAVVGPVADSHAVLEGNYNGISSRYVTFLEGIRKACEGKARVLYAEGSHLYKDRVQNLGMPDDRLAEAQWAAEEADVVIACLGLDATLEGEQGDTGNEYSSGDKNTLELPPCQVRLLETLRKTGKPLVLVLASGSSIRVEDGNAILWAGYPGQAGGDALAEILFGKTAPSGKLPVTFYKDLSDLPEFTDYHMEGRTYRYYEGTPLYPFGYGLTYGVVRCTGAEMAGSSVKATLHNESGRDLEDVVQVYAHAPQDPDETPHPHLAAFKRVCVPAGATVTVEVAVPDKAYTVVRQDGRREQAPGTHYLYVGTQQPDARSAELTGLPCVKLTVER